MERKAHIAALLSLMTLSTGCSTLFGDTTVNSNALVEQSTSQTQTSTTSKKTLISAKRANKLPELSLVQNREVKKELNELQNKPATVKKVLSNPESQIPKVKQIFKDEGVPQDLANVAFVESGFNEKAKSPAGAIGMWQFMKSTAKYYGLTINFKEDQRTDIILSSLAAARHLRDLYNNYNDWYLALAAYNVGAGAVDRAIDRAGTRDFWELARRGFLPGETARFVPRILAAAIIMKDPEAHGFDSANFG